MPADAIHYTPEAQAVALRQPIALAAFGGWVDAGQGGTGALRHLIARLDTRKLADLDPEEFYSFTDTRPLVSLVAPGDRAIQWPRAEFHAVPLPDHDADLLLFAAPEPNLRWRSFAAAALDVMQRFDARALVCLGSIFGAVPHRGEVRLTGWATDTRLRDGLQRQGVTFTNYEGPTGFVTVLVAEAHARGLPAAAVMGFAPNYIQGVPNPRVSLALLRSFSTLTGTPLDLSDLERSGRALIRQVDRLLAEQPQLREQVERMLSLMNVTEPLLPGLDDPEPINPARPAEPADPNVELPSPQAVVSELEEFLRQLRKREGDASDPDAGSGQ